jgi:hypothetical protein
VKRFLVPAFLTLTLILTACSASATPLPSGSQPTPVSTESSSPSVDSATRVDQQGAIVIEITPLNLDAPTDILEFDVVLTTHSIDLSMDLAKLSTLTTDTGVSVDASRWDAPLGGHHVEGQLIFPATEDGMPILEGATKLTITILNVDAPTRIFKWELK